MENTTYMNIPYPSENDDPFWDSYEAQMSDLDRITFMAKIQANLSVGGGGSIAFNAGSGLLTWSSDFIIPVFHYGKSITVKFGPDNINRYAYIPDGAALVIEVPYSITPGNSTQYFRVMNQLDPSNHQLWVAAWRSGAKVHIRGIGVIG